MTYEPLILRRAVALLIDSVLCFGSIALVWTYQTWAVPDETGTYHGMAGCALFLASAAFWLFYFAGSEAMFGRTLGKALAGVKVVTGDGARPTFGATVKRHLLDLVEFQLLALPAVLAVKLTARHQRLGDLWAGTHVVRDVPKP